MSLSKNLKKIRKENNLSQEQLADKLGVSRQAVSKWESGVAYPEMEKLVTISKMFNLNIDELINQDISEINETKQGKIDINKYVEDFLGYVTKVVDMFSSMSFKTKLKCFIEQVIVFCVLALIFVIIGSIGCMFIQDLLMILPDSVYYVIYMIIEDVYLILCFILGFVLMLHIFKIRYLDYYVIIKENRDGEEKEVLDALKEEEKTEHIFIKKESTKVIIRDPENAGDKFISLLFKGVLFFIKVFTFMFGSVFCLTLVFLCLCLVVLFMFVKTGLVFIGLLVILLASIIINLIILNILYNFIVNRRSRKNKLAFLFCLALIMLGIGGGLFCIGITDFEVTNDYSDYEVREVIVPYNDDLTNSLYFNVNYIESDTDDVRLVYKYFKYYDLDVYVNDGYIHFYSDISNDDIMNLVRCVIDDINNKKIIDYSYVSVDIYANSLNIDKLKDIYYE